MQPKFFDGFCSVVRLRHYLHVIFGFDQRGDSFAKQRMVVNRKYPNHSGITAHGLSPATKLESRPCLRVLVSDGGRNTQLHLCARSCFAPEIQLCSNLVCSFLYAGQSPMSLASSFFQDLRIYPLSIVADTHTKLFVCVPNHRFDLPCASVPESIS